MEGNLEKSQSIGSMCMMEKVNTVPQKLHTYPKAELSRSSLDNIKHYNYDRLINVVTHSYTKGNNSFLFKG